MGAVKRTVGLAHALQHDDPLASPNRVCRTRTVWLNTGDPANRHNERSQRASRPQQIHYRVALGDDMSGRLTNRAQAAAR